MYKAFRLTSSLIVIFAIAVCVNGSAQERSFKAKVHSAILEELKRKTTHSGTLDLYDEKSGKVRNLRMLKKQDDLTELDGKYFALIDYRDINTGDIVKIEVEVVKDGDDLSVEKFRIKDVQKLDAGESQKVREYTDKEVQAFMLEHLKKQTQFNDGKLMLYDKDTERMRNLELIELNKEVRRLGIFISSSSQFKDVDSGEILDIDISVENTKGKLKLQALRIRDVRKGSGSNEK